VSAAVVAVDPAPIAEDNQTRSDSSDNNGIANA
jgi:hypothetical protein